MTHHSTPAVQETLTVAAGAMVEWAASATGQQQVVTAQWCLSVKQHNTKKATWAAGALRVELPASRVAALVPDKRPDKQRRFPQAGPTWCPEFEGR